MIKRVLTLVLTLVLLFGLSTVALAKDQKVTIKFNGKNLTTDVDPVIRNKRTLVPVRAIAEALGADVTYEPKTKQITIVKLQDTYIFNLDKQEVYKNGVKLQDLEVPAQEIGGRTMVPARFITEVLGAKVDWDNSTFSVSIVHDEKRNGMTPVELYTKVAEAVYKQDTMKMKGNGSMSMKVSALPTPINIAMDFEGSYKKPFEFWMNETIKPAGPALLPNQEPVSVEVYVNGAKMYMKALDQPWEEVPFVMPADYNNLVYNYDPAKTGELVEKFGLILSHGNEVTINGKSYYTLNLRLDDAKLKELMKQFSANTPVMPGMELTPAEAKEARRMAQEMLKNMRFDLSYKIFIDKDTYLIHKGNLAGQFLMNVQGEKMTMKFDFDYEVYDYGVPVTIPPVAKK